MPSRCSVEAAVKHPRRKPPLRRRRKRPSHSASAKEQVHLAGRGSWRLLARPMKRFESKKRVFRELFKPFCFGEGEYLSRLPIWHNQGEADQCTIPKWDLQSARHFT